MENLIIRNIKRYYRNLRREIRKTVYTNRYHKQLETSFEKSIDSQKTYHLFITTDNLGGTRQYEKNTLKFYRNVILLRRLSYGERKDIIYEVTNIDINTTFLLEMKELNKIFNLNYSQITINTMVYMSCITEIIQYLIEYKKKNTNCYLRYLVHDFHSVCLNYNLYTNGHYCRLQCSNEKCDLRLADQRFSIKEWRTLWQSLFKCVDEIRCFSISSKEIICHAYPEIDDKKFSVVPHDLSYITFSPIKDIDCWPLHLGFIGNCNLDIKGRPVAKKIIEKYGNKIPISMIGSNYRFYRIRRKKVKYTGKYQHDDLQKIIEQEHISVAIFPSLWPETFSYLVSELIAMNIPILCFDYGAQAEKVRAYSKGIVCRDINEMYHQIEKLRG